MLLSVLWSLVVGAGLFATLVNMLLWVCTWPLAKHLRKSTATRAEVPDAPLVSVVMAVRNEAVSLRQNLTLLLNQDYPVYELVICNDNSTDQTADVLAAAQQQHARLKVLSLDHKAHPGKKHALATAIAASQGEWLLATDGDCRPASKFWIASMMRARTSDTEIILGYAPYAAAPGLLNRWIRFEAVYTAIQYFTAASRGGAYMGVGRNMAYTRELYQRIGGFTAHEHLTGGDDDLLVAAGATKRNVAICLEPNSWMTSRSEPTWNRYRRQKRRHVSVSSAYSKFNKSWLAALALSQVGHYIGVVALVASGAWLAAIAMYVSRQLLVAWQFARVAPALGAADLVVRFPLLDMGLVIYYLDIAQSALVPPKRGADW